MSNSDDLVARMVRDDRLTVREIIQQQEGFESVDDLNLMSPRDYAISRKMQPQQVYYYIKRGVIESIDCICHRHVIDANQADQALEERRKS